MHLDNLQDQRTVLLRRFTEQLQQTAFIAVAGEFFRCGNRFRLVGVPRSASRCQPFEAHAGEHRQFDHVFDGRFDAGVGFPVGDGATGDADALGQFLLGEARVLSGLADA